jgi:tRNA(fMet)-specific endonuclease VapC
MIKLYLLDTNIASYVIKNNVPSIKKKLSSIEPSQINISAITKAELLFGVEKCPGIKHLALAVNEFLIRVNILAWDDAAAESYAKLRATLVKTGKTMSNMDMLIAAQAIAENATLVTNDKAFSQIKELKVENWVK